VHVACPECGTGYRLEPATLERQRLRLRCRRCHRVWDPRHPFGEPAAPSEREAALAEAVARALEAHDGEDARDAPEVDAATPPVASATGAPRPPRRRLRTMLYALAGLMLLASGGGMAWAYRDALPFLGAPLPALTDVQPAWRDGDDGRRLVVSAQVENPGDDATEIRRVRVRFLSAEGAWIDETVVEVPALTVPAGGSSRLEMAVDRLPEGTASLELSLLPVAPVS
jgi:predicted Zn finger-like uncharacterized protein